MCWVGCGFFFSSRRRHTRLVGDWSSDVCSSDLDLDISPERWGWVVGAFTVSYAVFEIPSGAMGDRIGARAVLTRIVVWWSVFTSLTGTVSNYFLLLVTRFLFGAGEAGAYPNSSSSISRWFPTAERGRAHGFVWMASRICTVYVAIMH